MGLFDLFSNDSAEKAAQMANAGATAGYGQLSDLYGQGRGAITSNYGAGVGAINTNYGAGRDALSSGYGDAGNLYKSLLTMYAPGANAYGDASGANGAAGYQRATANFQTNPGYQFQMDQGLQALNRTHAAAGNLSSGNADTDTLKFATGLANQSYTNYLAGLQPYLGLNSNATMGAANVDTGLATGLNTSYAGQGNALNGAYQGQGTALNNSFTGQGNAANNTQTSIGNNNAGAELNNYKVGANLWNGIMGGLNFAAGGAGGQGGAGGVMKNASSLFGMFA